MPQKSPIFEGFLKFYEFALFLTMFMDSNSIIHRKNSMDRIKTHKIVVKFDKKP